LAEGQIIQKNDVFKELEVDIVQEEEN